ncbi:helix-turn-helix transcriptional regulator [Aquimarina gracilis]
MVSIFILASVLGYGQKFEVPDSLKSFTYLELERRFFDTETNREVSKQYANGYLQKSKKEDDSLNIAKGFYFKAIISEENKALSLTDSILKYSENLIHHEFPAQGYIEKGMQFFYLSRYDEALQNYIKAQEIALDRNNKFQLFKIKHCIGLLKNSTKNRQEALEIFKQNIDSFDFDLDRIEHKRQYVRSLFALANSYNVNKNIDSAEIINTRGIKQSLKLKSKFMYPAFLISYGATMNLKGQDDKALDSLLKGSRLLQNRKSSIASIYLMISKIHGKRKDYPMYTKYLKKVDSLFETHNPQGMRQASAAYDALIKYYRKNKDLSNQLIYMNKLIAIDSIINRKSKNVANNIIKNYDAKVLISEKEKIIKSLEKENTKISYQNIIVTIFLGLSLLGTGYYYHRQRLYKKRFLKLLEGKANNNQKKDDSNYSPPGSSSINKETLDKLLDKLQQFEEKQGYLQQGLNTKDLAKSFGSNSSYLSKVVNTFKEKSFTQYINDLRIDFVVDKLLEDTRFRKYTVKAIAQEIGFNNAEAFAKAFYKKPGFILRILLRS